MNLLIHSQILVFLIYTVLLVSPVTVSAEEPVLHNTILQTATFRFNNENWFTETHPKVSSFTVREDGSAYGTLETGIPFSQENIENELGIRIQRFVLQDHYHYIINGEIIYSLEDFSIQLAKAYRTQSQSAT